MSWVSYDGRVPLEPDDLVSDCPEFQVGLSLPGPLTGRLDGLVELAHAAGERTNRKEIVSALLLAAPESPQGIADTIRRYRAATVRDAMIEGQDEQRFRDPDRPSGPRPRKRRGV
jgi:hypothetical protein